MGAGMSHGLVPLPPALLNEKGVKAASEIGCAPPTPGQSLYEWADIAVSFLAADPVPKLTLARSLDLLTDQRWRGTKTQRSTPRHRVVARFSREGLFEQIWSLNWDCVQETAFENVGIERDRIDPRAPWD
jgi:hypothetical protein